MYQALITIRAKIKEALGNQIKSYFLDDPRLINLSSLPCISIVPVNTTIDIGDTSRDVYTYTIDIFLIINPLTQLMRVKEEMVGMKYLSQTMEEIEDDGLKTNTILYALRSNLALDDNFFIDNIGSVDYTVRLRAEQEVTLEAWCRLTITRIITR